MFNAGPTPLAYANKLQAMSFPYWKLQRPSTFLQQGATTHQHDKQMHHGYLDIMDTGHHGRQIHDGYLDMITDRRRKQIHDGYLDMNRDIVSWTRDGYLSQMKTIP